jgi:hypothetical protein
MDTGLWYLGMSMCKEDTNVCIITEDLCSFKKVHLSETSSLIISCMISNKPKYLVIFKCYGDLITHCKWMVHVCFFAIWSHDNKSMTYVTQCHPYMETSSKMWKKMSFLYIACWVTFIPSANWAFTMHWNTGKK